MYLSGSILIIILIGLFDNYYTIKTFTLWAHLTLLFCLNALLYMLDFVGGVVTTV